ncbi:MAG: hypothetical protein FRX48_02727 [Lasallia pustulata]|uniref:Uncharacterized protein n=1 Tax=Lasallia pustulata TaxID=136370 RepID=A0A5M8PVC7_9LECA|nr:MAG: hypothetical protein FRX48_02727 [Lasallia pustulata]
MKPTIATLATIVAITFTLKGVAAAALPEPQSMILSAVLGGPQWLTVFAAVTFSDGDSIHYASKRGHAHVAAQNFVTRHSKDIGIVAKAEVIEDCAAPCDFYINSVDEPEPAKREVELVKESEDLEDCAAPCDFYVRSEESADILVRPLPLGPAEGPALPQKRAAELVKESEDLEECAAPCDFYVRSEKSADMQIHGHSRQVGLAEGPGLPEKRDAELVKESEETEDCAAPCDFYIRSVDEDDAVEDDLAKLRLAKKSDDTADEEDAVEDDLATLWLAKKSDDTADEEDAVEDDLAKLWLAKKSDDTADEEDVVEDGLAKVWLAKKSDDTADEEDVVEDDLAKVWLAKKSDDTADDEDCAAPCDFYVT